MLPIIIKKQNLINYYLAFKKLINPTDCMNLITKIFFLNLLIFSFNISAWAATSSYVDIKITIPHVIKVNFINHNDSLIISSEDVRRGYIEIEKRVEIINNSHAGVDMCIHYDPYVLSGLKINFNENFFNIFNKEACEFNFLGKVFKKFSMKYHFLLKKDLPAGVYAWPVNIIFKPYNL